MKRLQSNLITIVFAAVVLLAGVLFSSFILPAITDDGEEDVLDCNVKLTNPQEIIEQPSTIVNPVEQFPTSYEGRVLLNSQQLDEQTVQARKNFLNMVSEAVDVLFNIKIDGIIMEKHTQIWRNQGQMDGYIQESAFGESSDDAFAVDVLFTDARATRWRITAEGYADTLIHVSCIENNLVFAAPGSPANDKPNEAAEKSDKLDNAVNRFRTKLYSLPNIGSMVKQESCTQYSTVVIGAAQDVLWAVFNEYDGCYLAAGFLKGSFTPVSYTFLNFEQETGYDFYRSFLDSEKQTEAG